MPLQVVDQRPPNRVLPIAICDFDGVLGHQAMTNRTVHMFFAELHHLDAIRLLDHHLTRPHRFKTLQVLAHDKVEVGADPVVHSAEIETIAAGGRTRIVQTIDPEHRTGARQICDGEAVDYVGYPHGGALFGVARHRIGMG